MKLPKYKILRALRSTMKEHRWGRSVRGTFIKSFCYYINLEQQKNILQGNTGKLVNIHEAKMDETSEDRAEIDQKRAYEAKRKKQK